MTATVTTRSIPNTQDGASMSTDLAHYQPATSTVAPAGLSIGDMVRYAELLSASGLLPKEYRQKPANVLFAVEYGRTLGVTPIAAITGIHVIDGKPSASAGLMGALVRKAGHKLRVSGDDKSATAQIIRADDPDHVFEVVFTLEDAERAGLCQIRNGRVQARDKYNKPMPWETYTRSMLKARAISAVARDAAEDVLFGLHYTPEELGAVVDQDGNPVDAPVQPLQSVPAQRTAGEPAAEPRDFLTEAKAATGADAAVRVYYEAEAAGVPADTLNQIKEVGRAKRATEQQAAEADLTAAAKTHPAEPSPTAPTDGDRDAALTELRNLAEGLSLSAADLESGFRDTTGVDLADATADQIRNVIGILRGNAA